MIGPRWQISAGEFFELLRPAAWTLSTLISACVLADARRRRLPLSAVAAWTITTLLYPLVFLPLYIITRFTGPGKAGPVQAEPSLPAPSRARTMLLASLYALLVLSLVGLYFYLDSRSVDAHLARANQARLLNQPARTIREYRAALRLEDDAHTRNLLATELAGAGEWEEAIAEMRAARAAGEPDETIPYRIASLLDLLKRREEAAREYQNFLNTRLCAQSFPDARCASARLRVRQEAWP